jgi:hypothetical protein
MILTRPEPLTFERADGTKILAMPATRGQMREVFVLDRDEPDPAERRGKAVAILLRGACKPEILDSLTAEEEQDIIAAFSGQHVGIAAPTAVALHQAMREALKKKAPTPGRRRK